MSSLLEQAPRALTSHSAHPHTLTLVHTITGGGGALSFRCDGCQQPILDEARYHCDPCNFDLHIPCALAQPAIAHPRFGGCPFTFFTGAGAGSRFCHACGDPVLGFSYHSQISGLDLHPCCASLKDTIVYNGRLLHLLGNQPAGAACNLCGEDQYGRRGRFWTYGSFLHGNMHVACMLYGVQNPSILAGPAGISRSISAASSIETTFTPIQTTPSPNRIQTTFKNFYSFGRTLTDIAGGFVTGGSTNFSGC